MNKVKYILCVPGALVSILILAGALVYRKIRGRSVKNYGTHLSLILQPATPIFAGIIWGLGIVAVIWWMR